MWYYYGTGTVRRKPSFLSDHVRFRFVSLAELMHTDGLSAAMDRYRNLGGDVLLQKFDYDPLPECAHKRLEVAEQLTKELRHQDQWMRLGRQPLADGGIQFFCMFEGMFRQTKREFVDKTFAVLHFEPTDIGMCVTKNDFIAAIDSSLRPMVEGVLYQASDYEYIEKFIDCLFAKLEFVDMLFKHRPATLERLKNVLPLHDPSDDIDVFAYAFRLCCEAVVGSPEERCNRIGRVCKLGNPKHLYPLLYSQVTLL